MVARDGTLRAGATILQLPARHGSRSYAGRRVELHLRLDGRLVVWDGEREILSTTAPADPAQLRALDHARVDVGTPVPSGAPLSGPRTSHPWRRIEPGSKLYRRNQAAEARLTGSPSR